MDCNYQEYGNEIRKKASAKNSMARHHVINVVKSARNTQNHNCVYCEHQTSTNQYQPYVTVTNV
jgi:hypothetical protein